MIHNRLRRKRVYVSKTFAEFDIRMNLERLRRVTLDLGEITASNIIISVGQTEMLYQPL
jgi:hypothetical protein